MMKWIITAASAAAADLAAKHYIHNNYEENEERAAAGGNVVVTRYENKGAMLGLLSDKPDVLKTISSAGLGAALAVFCASVAHRRSFAEKLGMALVSGGAFSNVAERTARGCVTDYLKFPGAPGPLRKMIFNLGDFAIFIGSALALIGEFFSLKRSGKN